MLPIIIKMCIPLSEMLKCRGKKCILELRNGKLFCLSLSLQPSQGQDATLCPNTKPQPSSIGWLTEGPDNTVKTKNKEWTRELILLTAVSPSIEWVQYLFSSRVIVSIKWNYTGEYRSINLEMNGHCGERKGRGLGLRKWQKIGWEHGGGRSRKGSRRGVGRWRRKRSASRGNVSPGRREKWDWSCGT